MRTVDRVLAFVCAVTAAFALAFAVGRLVGPAGPAGEPVPLHSPGMSHGR